MGNLFSSSSPPLLYARPAAAAAGPPETPQETAALAVLASRFPPLHARDVEPAALLAAPARLADGVFLGSFEHARK